VGFGPLRFLFVSPEFHHWHHSNNSEARDRNFAAQLYFLDALFGSFHLPRGQIPTTYGLDRPMPQRYVPQLLYPFIGERIFQSKQDTAELVETMGPRGSAQSFAQPRSNGAPCLTNNLHLQDKLSLGAGNGGKFQRLARITFAEDESTR
jgi:hypothetical protein